MYHLRETPVAFSAMAGWFWQYVTVLLVTTGTAGIAFTLIVTWSVLVQVLASVPVTVYVAVEVGEIVLLFELPLLQI